MFCKQCLIPNIMVKMKISDRKKSVFYLALRTQMLLFFIKSSEI